MLESFDCNLWDISRECHIDKEGLFLYINILIDFRYRVGKTQVNVLG